MKPKSVEGVLTGFYPESLNIIYRIFIGLQKRYEFEINSDINEIIRTF